MDSAGSGSNWIFILSLTSSAVLTLIFGFGKSMTLFATAWILNRLVQSITWGAMMKMVSFWYDYTSHSSIVGALSLSYLFGDAFARLYLGLLNYFGLRWDIIMWVSSATLFILVFPSYFLLYPDPESIGEKQTLSNPDTLVKDDSKGSIFTPLLLNPGFYIICFISAGFTFIRECLRDWVHTFFSEKSGITNEVAPLISIIFPLAGGFSSIITGLFMDRYPKKKGIIMTIELFVLCIGTLAITILCFFLETIHWGFTVPLIGIISFALTGPYALLQVFALDLGGKRGAASISSILDTVGYIFGSLSGWGTAYLKVNYKNQGWFAIFLVLTTMSIISTVLCVVYYFFSERKKKTKEQDSQDPSIN